MIPRQSPVGVRYLFSEGCLPAPAVLAAELAAELAAAMAAKLSVKLPPVQFSHLVQWMPEKLGAKSS
eukprot:gene4699-biopygen7182